MDVVYVEDNPLWLLAGWLLTIAVLVIVLALGLVLVAAVALRDRLEACARRRVPG